MRCRNWCWTLNNYTDDDVVRLSADPTDPTTYLVFGREVGENGTPHLQGYAEFKRPMSLAQAKARIDARAHLEPRRGSQAQAIEYCQKDGQFTEVGEKKAQGRRTDLVRLAEAAAAAPRPEAVFHQFPGEYVRYHRGIAAAWAAARVDPAWPAERDPAVDVVVEWLHGPTGAGKTRRAWETAGDRADVYLWTSEQVPWWDGYAGQPVVIMEEFRGEIPWTKLLSLWDRYPLRLPVKGGFTQMCASRFIVTSDRTPRECFPTLCERAEAQLMRRITEVVPVRP